MQKDKNQEEDQDYVKSDEHNRQKSVTYFFTIFCFIKITQLKIVVVTLLFFNSLWKKKKNQTLVFI